MRKQFWICAGILTGATALMGQMKTEYGGAAFQFYPATGAAVESRAFTVEPLGSQVVTGRPFSATEERHSLQVLGDGTKIESTETNKLYRDEQGRTRTERKGGNVTIYDPVAGFTAELDPNSKTVSKTTFVFTTRSGGGGVVAAGDLQKRLDEMKASGATAGVRTIPGAAVSSAYSLAYSTTIANADKLRAEGAATPRALTTITTSNGPMILRVDQGDNASVESLTPQSVNGVLAQGTRTTETIPAGKIGNDRPISVVNERWFSDELKMLVKSTSKDPRFGETTYELTNIGKTSPDPSLFLIPADYTIRK